MLQYFTAGGREKTMSNYDFMLGEVEGQFANIIWNTAPVTSTELVKIAAEKLGWKRTTTHTVIRRLCDKGLFSRDKSGIVTALMSKDDFRARQSKQFVDITCGGSLPLFVSGFVKNNSLSQEEIAEIVKMLEKR